ncbi:vinculin isoform X2 [Lethenteron reissneri]|uniref:vinculin isoform X2 n=1 Tax=Lethenteron reissneri TaxID=7753 RepID=UPI002AB644A5|nr:vinculin isoform X2 [Lethenteron reissneri]
MEALALAGLAGSGLGLSSLAPSLSAQRVLAPISAQLVHLALLCDSALHHEQHHHHHRHHHHPHPRQSHQHERQQCQRCDVLLNLEPQAQALAEAAEALAVSSRRLSAESEDETTRREMPAAAERLLVAGRSVLLAALDLRVERRRRRRVAVGRLLSSATALVAAMLEVLTISDDTEVRRVERAAEWLHERASALGSVQSAAEFATEARGFSESLLLLMALGESRAAEMQAGGRRRRRLDRALQTTRRCVPLIHTAVRTSLECPGSERAAAGRDRAVRRFSRAVSGVAAAARKGRRRRSEGGDGEVVHADEGSPRDATGTFADNVIRLVATLRRMNPGTKQEEEQENASEQTVTLDCLVEAVAAHAVTVMGETEHEGTRRRLSETCQRLLQCRSRLAARLRTPETDAESARAAAASGSFSHEREQMLREAAALQRILTLAVTTRVADAFAETTEPLERLLRAWDDRDGGDEGGRDDGALGPLADAFLAHADGMVRGAVLAHASCSDARRALALRNRAALARRLASAARRELTAVGVRALAQSGLRQEWHREVDALLASLCRAVDVRGLADAVNASLGRFAHRFQDAVRGGGGSRDVAETARATAGRAKLMARAARYFVSNHDDPLFRNGLLALVGPLESCTTLFAFEVNRHLRATESGDGRERGEGGDGDLSCSNESLVVVVAALLERSQQLVGHASRVREGLSGSACHPDLLSPLRENLRNEGLDELTEIPDVVDVASRRAAMMTREHSTAAQHVCDRRDPEQDKRACCGVAIAAGGHEDDCQATRSRLDDLSLLPAFSAVVRAAGLAHSDEAIRGSERRVRTLVDSYGEAVAKAKLGDPRCGEDSTWSDIDGRISGLREMTSRLLEEAGRIRDGGQGDAYSAASMALALRCSDGIRELQELLSRRLQPWLRLAREASDAAVTTDEPSPIAAVREVAASLAASAALMQKGGSDRPSGLRAAKERRAGWVEQAALASPEPRLEQALLAVEEATRGLVGRGSGDGAERGSGDADERCEAAVGKCLAWAACVTSALGALRRRTCVGGGVAAGLTGGVVRAVREGDRPALGVETRALLETCERLKETAGLAARAQTTARSNGGHGNGDNSSGDRDRGLASLTLDEVALMSGAGDSACELARELAESAGLLLARAASPGGWAMARLAARVELLSTEVEARAHILSALIDRATASSARALLVTLGLEEEEEENEGKDEKSGKEVAEVVSRTCLEEQLSEVEAAVRAALTQRPSNDHLGAAVESACRSLRWSAAQIDLALASRRQPEVGFSADAAARAQRGGELRDERWCERRDELQLAAWAWGAASGSIAADLSAHLGPESPTVRDVVRRLRLEPVQENASAREKVDDEEEEKEEEIRPGVPPMSSPGAAKEAKRAGSSVPESPAAAARRAFFAEMRQAGRAGRAAQESEPAAVDRPRVPEAPPLPAEKAASVCGGGAAPSPSTHARRIEPRPCPLAPWDSRAVPDVARVAQDMASRVQDMALFLRRRGPIKSREGLIACARSLAVDARTLERFGGALAGLCAEERCSRELLSHSQRVLAAGTQIAILASLEDPLMRAVPVWHKGQGGGPAGPRRGRGPRAQRADARGGGSTRAAGSRGCECHGPTGRSTRNSGGRGYGAGGSLAGETTAASSPAGFVRARPLG